MTIAAGSVAYRDAASPMRRTTRRGPREARPRRAPALVVVDVQEAFAPAVLDFERASPRRRRWSRAPRLGCPCWSPSSTRRARPQPSPEVAEHLDGVDPIEKLCFSAAAGEGFASRGRDQVASMRHRVPRLRQPDGRGPARHGRRGARRRGRGQLAHRGQPRARACTRWSTRRGRDERRDGAVRVAGERPARPEFKEVQALVNQSPDAATLGLDGLCPARGRHAAGRRSGGAAAATLGEVVFNTPMTGYQESVTDPSTPGRSSPSPIR